MHGVFCAFMLIAVGGSATALAQPSPARRGTPPSVTHYLAQEYRAEPTNWSVTQDRRGLVYVANNDGILQYDGARWRLIRTTTGTFVRSVAADSQGTVYAGAVGDFGYLRPDSTATLRYVSLVDEVEPGARDFDDVWNVLTTKAGVYFQARGRLFRWDGQEMQSWTSEEGFHTSFVVHGQFYVREIGRGLLRMEDDSLRVVPGGERFAELPIYTMLPRGEEKILIGTRPQFLLEYDGKTFTRFSTEADSLLSKHRLYHGCMLPGGEMALATLGGGVLIVDQEGRLVQVLNKETALPGNVVNYVYADAQGGLWMAMHNEGVVRAEVSSPLSRFSENFGLEGIVYNIHWHNNTLYVGTGTGLYALRWTGEEKHSRPRFEQIRDVPLTNDILSTGGALLAATDRGIYRVRNGRGQAIAGQKVFTLTESRRRPGHIYAGTGKGLAVLQRERSGWAFQIVAQTDSEVRSVTEDKSGAIWLKTGQGEILRLPPAELDTLEEATEKKSGLLQAQSFDRDDGLPGNVSFVMTLGGEPVAVSKRGIYRARRTPAGPAFRRDTTLTGSLGARDSLRALYENDAGDAWLFYENRVEVAEQQADGSYARREPPALQFSQRGVSRALVDPVEGSIWISNKSELLRYDTARAAFLQTVPVTKPEVLVRQVRDAARGEVFYGGAGPPDEPPSIPYDQNTLSIRYALPRFGGEAPTEYQYRLKEGGEEWSAWAPESHATLGKLQEDTYELQVRARRKNEEASLSTTTMTFHVLPPWYRTPWAYLSYLAGAALLAVGYQRYRVLKEESRRAQEQARELIREREARERLREANEQLEQANKLKENFLANTSHELRTPLAAILGYTEVLQEENPTEQQREFLGEIHESGQRLSNTLNMLLDVAQLRAGVKEIHTDQLDVTEEVERVVESFRPQAEEKGLALHLEVPDREAPERAIPAQLPAGYFRKVIQNLLDNAVKFTREGSVSVSLEEDEASHVSVHIRDTGPGIADSFVPNLFDEFNQASGGTDRAYDGVGLGLTIAARLTRLMNGTIEVETAKGEGSTFTARFPKYLSEPPEPAENGEAAGLHREDEVEA